MLALLVLVPGPKRLKMIRPWRLRVSTCLYWLKIRSKCLGGHGLHVLEVSSVCMRPNGSRLNIIKHGKYGLIPTLKQREVP